MRRNIFIILVLAASCARVPDCDLQSAAGSSGLSIEAEAAIAAGDFVMGEGPKLEWWKELEDPVLNQLIEEGLKKSPTLQQAEARLKAALQVAVEKKALLFPEIDFQTEDNWRHLPKFSFFRAFAPPVPTVVNEFSFGLSFNYEFDFWGKYRDLYRAALGESRAMAAERMQAELILSTSIAYTYAQAQLLLKKRQLLEKKEANKNEIVAIRASREKNALDTALEQLFSRSEALDTKATLIELNQQIKIQVNKLKELAGIGQDAELNLVLHPLPPLQVTLPDNLSLDLLARRPDLFAQRSRVESAAQLINAAKTDFYPNINLKGLLGLDSIFWPKLLRSDSYNGSLNPALHLPIFTAGRLRAQLMGSVSEFNEAISIYNNLILQAAREVVDQLTIISSLNREIDVRKASLEVVEKQGRITEKRMQNALDDKIAYLTIQNRVLDADLALTELEFGNQLAKIGLIRALGGGYLESCD